MSRSGTNPKTVIIKRARNADRQRAYRERHLRRGGGKRRIRLFVAVPTRKELERLARHKRYTVTAPAIDPTVVSAVRLA